MCKCKAASLVKKTLVWRHRSKGKDVVSFPCGREGLRKLYMLGNTEADEDGTLHSLGDDVDGDGSYCIPLLIHGKAVVNGRAFLESIKSILNSNYKEATDMYVFTTKSEHDGTVICNRDTVKFKPKTPYTVYVRGDMFRGGGTLTAINLAFRYDDGTLDPISIPHPSGNRIIFGCFTSNKDKSVTAIEIKYYTSRSIGIYGYGFGIFEGIYTNPKECYEEYSGTMLAPKLKEPLRSVDLFSDEFDLLTGVIKRRIAYVPDLSSLDVSEDEYELPSLLLPERANTLCGIVSPGMNVVSAEALLSGENGIALSEDGERIYIRIEGVSFDCDGISSFLAENPTEITYVKEVPSEENTGFAIEYREGLTVAELHSSTPSRRFMAEYE